MLNQGERAIDTAMNNRNLTVAVSFGQLALGSGYTVLNCFYHDLTNRREFTHRQEAATQKPPIELKLRLERRFGIVAFERSFIDDSSAT